MYEDQLARVPLFAGLNRSELSRMAGVCRWLEYQPATPLVWQGTPGAAFFIIESGKVRILQQRQDGDVRELAVLGPGDTFGEMALLDEMPRSATALAIELTSALALPVWEFRAILKEEPDITLKLLAVLSARLRSHAQQTPSFFM
ncbi:MAG TPA: cyclic nucleotide-binding domain-containing protein [Ktedonobacterales bacterium]|nr:cyclic nucleotide-binding domain-containing protein [Ktedonobacterales bacterium]